MRSAACAFAVWLVAVSVAWAQPFAFHADGINAGGNPRGIVAADFDGDGHLDFATANYQSAPHDVSVWYGDGHGGFSRPEFHAVGAGPFSIAAADLNHDGHPDLAVAVADAYKVTILLWTPTGFAVSANIVFPPVVIDQETRQGSPREVAIADFNRDGNADMVYALDMTEGTFEITLGAGDGIHWERHSSLNIGRGVHGLAIADLNNDGLPDFVGTNAVDGQVHVAYNAGSGNAGPVETYSVGRSPRNVTIGDFNHDRYPDFATVNTDSGTASIYFQNPAATAAPHFGNRVTVPNTGVSSRDIEAVDADGDGVVDLAISDYGEDRLLVLKNDGTGHFPPEGRVRLESVSAPRTLAIGDFNEDGRPDILVGNQRNGAVILFTNDTPFRGRP